VGEGYGFVMVNVGYIVGDVGVAMVFLIQWVLSILDL